MMMHASKIGVVSEEVGRNKVHTSIPRQTAGVFENRTPVDSRATSNRERDRIALLPGLPRQERRQSTRENLRSKPASDYRVRDYTNVSLHGQPAMSAAMPVLEGRNSSTAEGAIIGGVLGAIVGAGIGFAAGGPVGAVIGGFAGAGVGAGIGAAIGSAVGGAAAGQAGNARSVDLQPVVFRNDATDAAPTGGSWSRRLTGSNTIWGKLGVSFNDASPVTIDNSTLKTAGSDRAERDAIRASHSDASKVCVFLTDNDLADAGGGGTVGGGAPGGKIALSDRGTSDTLLAHELGHILGLDHPPAGADANTVMEPSSSINVDNPTRNTIGNYNRIVWPAAGAPVTIHPDP